MYLSDAIQGSYGEKSEDRLSQIFAATFNESVYFRKLLLKFLSCKLDSKNLIAQTQQTVIAKSGRGRLDILILDSRKSPKLIIENKVDAPLLADQLKLYNQVTSLRKIQKFAFVKHFFQFSRPPFWEVRHWSEFHGFLQAQPVAKLATDHFLIYNFLQHLKEMGMSRITRIENIELKKLAEAVMKLRGRELPEISLAPFDIFETASQYVSMLEQLVDLIRQDVAFNRILKKGIRFTPWVSAWGSPPKDLWLGFESRSSRNIQFGTGLFFDSKRGTYSIQTYVNSNKYQSIKHKFKHLEFDEYANEALIFWRKQLNRY